MYSLDVKTFSKVISKVQQ